MCFPTVLRLKQLRLKLTSQQATFLMNIKQTDKTQAHVEKKNHLKINRPGRRNHYATRG